MPKTINIEGDIYANWGEIMSSLADATDATIYINSGGGSVTEGFAMADAIRRHSANIEIIGTGIVASIATIILLAAPKGGRKMTENSWLMIHDPEATVEGRANKLRQLADAMEGMTQKLENVYYNTIAENGKLIGNSEEQTRAQIRAWMDAEKWFTAQQAFEAGLIDAVVDAQDYDTATVQNCIKGFSNVPIEIKNKMEHTDISKDEKTLFQKFLAFLGVKVEAKCTPEETKIESQIQQSEDMQLTPEQIKEYQMKLEQAGYTVVPVEEVEMTEDEIMAALAENGVKMEKKAAPAAETVEAKLKAENEALREQLAREKQGGKGPKVPTAPQNNGNKTKRELAIEKVVADNLKVLEGNVELIKNKMKTGI